eukprot:14732900-Heterocapsa_arctica.AAC.1
MVRGALGWFRAHLRPLTSTPSSGPSFSSRSLQHRRVDHQRETRLSGGTRSSGILAASRVARASSSRTPSRCISACTSRAP